MDRITKSLLDEFVRQNGLEAISEDQAFEHFTGYLVTSQHYTETFSTEEIHIGSGGDTGIDSISIIVNGCLINAVEEIEDLVETNGYLDATFVFNQAERSSSFDTSKVGQFHFGVMDFFKEKPSLPQNAYVKAKSKIVNDIFDRSSKFKKGNPMCFLYYCTTGKWVGDQSLVARKENVTSDLQLQNIFRKVDFEFIDAEKIQNLFRATKNAISTEINFQERTVLPELPGIEQAYLGFLSSNEYFKLIENSNEEIITSIFYDNVRHWQDWNRVNLEIKETVSDLNKQIYFPLLNNGVTIIAKKISPTGNKFVLDDYQIVNGCQTSYVLHECKSYIKNSIFIPVRLIATQNPEIRNAIIKATNRQTEVTEEQLFALADFPKKLETYFPTFEGQKRLYYERRSRQYNADESVEKVRVINMTSLVRSYASFFLGLPHRTTRNYKALLRSIGTDIFNKDHRLEMYYVAAFAYYKLEYFFRTGALSSSLKQARYLILYLFRLQVGGSDLPKANSNEMGRFCTTAMSILWDENKIREKFLIAATIIEKVSEGNLYRDNIMTETFTQSAAQSILNKPSRQNK